MRVASWIAQQQTLLAAWQEALVVAEADWDAQYDPQTWAKRFAIFVRTQPDPEAGDQA